MPAVLPVDVLIRDPGAFGAGKHVVLALCAEWCGTCRSFRPMLEQLASAHPQVIFAWLDIEDDAELAGDLEVESFPTLAIFGDGRPLYFGATLPMADVVANLIRAVTQAGAPLSPLPDEIGELAASLFAASGSADTLVR